MILGTARPAVANVPPSNVAEYLDSVQRETASLARRMRAEFSSTWIIAENGACGPTFRHDDLVAGFSAVFVLGPGIERGALIRSSGANCESNMWGFTGGVLDFFAECIEQAASARASASACTPTRMHLIEATEDRYGGIECTPITTHKPSAKEFEFALREHLAKWTAASKRGVWLRLPLSLACCTGAAAACGFEFHHAQAEYLLMTRWLPETPSPLPRYGFTTIGVGDAHALPI